MRLCFLFLDGLAQLIPSTLEEIQIAATALRLEILDFVMSVFLPFPAQLLCSSSFAGLTSACSSVIMVHGVLSEPNHDASLSSEVAEVATCVVS